MEGAIMFFVLVVIGILILPIFIAANTNAKIKQLKDEILQLKFYIKNLQNIEPTSSSSQQKSVTPNEAPSQEILPENIPPVESLKPPIIEEEISEHEASTEESIDELLNAEFEASESIIEETRITDPNPPRILEEEIIAGTGSILNIPRAQSAPKKKTNFEQFIGEKLMSIVGIAILVLGIFFIVKWAIDKKLINDAGKVLIGLLSGTILIATAHKLSKNYRAFSSIIAGGGIAVFYFSIYEAFQSYHLLPQTAAFTAMIFVTILAVMLAIIYDKKELAIIALIGGFCTPFFVSTGSGNYQVLFSYLLILNIGMFCLAYFKKWNLIQIVSYGFTVLIFAIWMIKNYDISKGHNTGGFLFATLFFLVFFGMNIIYNLRYKTKFAALEIGLLLSNSFLYLGVGLFFLHSIHEGKYQGIFTISLAAFNFVFAYLFYRKNSIDKNLIYLLIALVLTFLSLTGPIQLEGNYITLFWACEMVILYWLGIKSGISVIKNSSIALLFLTLISLLLDWQNNYYSVHIHKYPFFFNKAFITGLIVLSALFLKRKYIKNDNEEILLWGVLPKNYYRYFTEIVLLGVFYLAGFLELLYQTNHTYAIQEFRNVIAWLYQYIFATGLLLYVLRKKPLSIQKMTVAVSMFLLLLYIAANNGIVQLRDIHLTNSTPRFLYSWHYLIPLFALILVYLISQFIKNNYDQKTNWFTYSAWFLTTIFVYVLSCEIINIWVLSSYEPGFSVWTLTVRAVKIALPILWSLCSLALMVFGMRLKIKIFRIISISLFAITILKLFIYDISNVSQGGKIAAFIILGIILLLVSFMYQKIKGLFIEEEEENDRLTQSNLPS